MCTKVLTVGMGTLNRYRNDQCLRDEVKCQNKVSVLNTTVQFRVKQNLQYENLYWMDTLGIDTKSVPKTPPGKCRWEK